MFGIGILGWMLVVIASSGAGALAYYLFPSRGVRSRKPSRMNIDEPIPESVREKSATGGDVECTVVLGDLFGTDVISGYTIGGAYSEEFSDEDQPALVRP
jgi:hypothetical protein